ncbi:MAG: type II/IV secretion system ATPase subunit [Candidatus Micrarchaeaceae archaeon]
MEFSKIIRKKAVLSTARKLIIKKPQAPSTNPRYDMSFDFLDNYPQEVLFETPNAVVGKSGTSLIYSVKAHPEWLSGRDLANTMKSYMVNIVLETGNTQYNIGDKNTIDSAAGLLSERFGVPKNSIALRAAILDLFGYGPLSFLLEDSANIEEIVINGPSYPVSLYHSRYGFCTTNIKFASERDSIHCINKLLESADKELASDTPIVDASTLSGLRIHAQQAPYSPTGMVASIRLSKPERSGPIFLLAKGTLNPGLLAFLWMAVDARLNLLVTGPPASGKTTLLKALAEIMPRYERVVAIEEETDELIMHSNFTNAVYLIGKKPTNKSDRSISDQVINALRLRPDRLIIGEIRGAEAKDAFFGSNTGVPFMATMHVSGTGVSVISRLESRPMLVDHALVSNLDLAVNMSLDGVMQRRITGISEYKWFSRAETSPENPEELEINNLFSSSMPKKDELRHSKVIAYFAMRKRISPSEAIKEFQSRSNAISSFISSGSTDFQECILGYKGFK